LDCDVRLFVEVSTKKSDVSFENNNNKYQFN